MRPDLNKELSAQVDQIDQPRAQRILYLPDNPLPPRNGRALGPSVYSAAEKHLDDSFLKRLTVLRSSRPRGTANSAFVVHAAAGLLFRTHNSLITPIYSILICTPEIACVVCMVWTSLPRLTTTKNPFSGSGTWGLLSTVVPVQSELTV